ncbi:MAG: hypothetical protein P1V81_17785 [Planctomycetota bacterium]|nr:hypothetical protein [Planctomycetota bacterium]
MSNDTSTKTPVSLWIVGVVSLLWNAMGGYDYVMTHSRDETYLANFTPEQLAYLDGYPGWMVSFWAIGVWGGVLGSVLLLLRKSLAGTLFAASFLAVVVATVRNFVFAEGFEAMGTGGALFAGAIFLAALGQLLYARAMRARGVLR